VPGTPPQVNGIPNQILGAGINLTINLSDHVSRTEGDLITGYAITGGALPAWLSFNPLSGQLTGIALVSFSSSTWTASDNDGQLRPGQPGHYHPVRRLLLDLHVRLLLTYRSGD
jgi:hypothetical protein